MKRYLFAVVPAIFVIFVLGIVPEFAARIFYRIRSGEWPISMMKAAETAQAETSNLFLQHSMLPFVLRPGARLKFMDTFVEINSRGFRGPELRNSTPLRILVVGGSTTFDTGVTDNSKMWTAVLGRKLEASFHGIEIINSGLPVYGISSNYLKYVLYDNDLRPDVVLIYQGVNDTTPWVRKEYLNAFQNDYWLYRGLANRLWAGLQGARSQIESPALGWTANSILLWGVFNNRGRNETLYSQLVRGHTADECVPDRVLQKNLQLLRYFINTIEKDGALAIFVPQSEGTPERKNITEENFKALLQGLEKLNRAYIRVSLESGAKVMDFTPVMDRWTDLYFRDTLHFSDTGAQALAELLANALAQDRDLRQIYARNTQRR
jgi:lysophospholipase L1-like esterase